MEIKDNELLRQFEIITETGLVAIEYSVQERKLFLTKFCNNNNEDEERKETLDALREELSRELKLYAMEHPKEAKKLYGIEAKKEEQTFSFAQALSVEVYNSNQLLKFVRSDIGEIQKKQQIEIQALQAQAMALSMH